MPSDNVLYYPYTHFRSPAWLKVAALYYEGITRMIPEQFAPRDSKEVRELTDAGFLHQVDTRSSAEAIAQDFIDYSTRYLREKPERELLFPELAGSGASFRIQPGKMAAKVRETLEFIHPQIRLPEHGDDFDLDAVTGGVYMAFLAKRMAAELSMPVVTHDPTFQRLIYKPFDPTANVDVDMGEPTFALASLVIQSALPADPHSISVASIIKFRRKHSDARAEFYEAVKELVSDFDPTAGAKALEDTIRKKQSQVERKVKSLRASMLDVGIPTIQNFLYCSVPSWLVGKWGLGLESSHLVVGTAVLSASLSLCRGYRDLNKLKRESPWAYVLSLNRLKAARDGNNILKLF